LRNELKENEDDFISLIKIFLSHGARLDALNSIKETALLMACKLNLMKVAHTLIEGTFVQLFFWQ